MSENILNENAAVEENATVGNNGRLEYGMYNYNGESIPFYFKTFLRVSEKAYFVNSVSEMLIGDDYNSVLDDLMFDFFIIDVFTDIDMSWCYENGVIDKETIDKIEDFILDTNIVDIVVENASGGLIGELRDAVDLNIEYKTGIHRNPISESIANLIGTLERKIEGFTVDNESLMGMIDVLGGISGEITADKMIGAYAKSNMFKEQHEQVVKKQEKRDAAMHVVMENAKKKIESGAGSDFKAVKGGKESDSSTTPVLSPDYEV